MTLSLFDRRAVLFLPASNPRAIEKARASDADLVVLDLEDAVKPDDKAAARDAAVEAVAGDWPMPVAIRVNGARTLWHDDDVAAVARSGCDLAVLPAVLGADEVGAAWRAIGKPVAAMIEKAAAVIDAPFIAREAAMLIVGTNDLRAEIGIETGGSRAPIMTSLQLSVLAARASRIPVIDGVYNRLDDPDGFLAEAREGRSLGFDGKSLIHPNQIELTHQVWAPSEGELDRARRLIAAATGGAERFDGEMIERMHVAAAERLVARSR